MRRIRTVLGDLAPEQLGRTNTHEHVFQVSPLLAGDEIDDPQRSAQEIASLRDSGFEAMIDATPIGLGRRPRELATISRDTGVHVVATTGFHRDAHYGGGPAEDPLQGLDVQQRTAQMLADIEQGMPLEDRDPAAARTDVPAGVLKVGLEYWDITPDESRTIEAIGAVHRRTDAPVLVHLEFCTAAHEVLTALEENGVDPSAVLLAHADRAPDLGLHQELVDRGAMLGFDGMARSRVRTDQELLEHTEALLASGRTRIVLGGDVARARRYRAYGGMPGLAYLGERYLPRLRRRIGDQALHQLLVENPQHYLARNYPPRPDGTDGPTPSAADREVA